jgi:hypothetical protein
MFDKVTFLRIGFLAVGLGMAAIPNCHVGDCLHSRGIGQAADGSIQHQRRSANRQKRPAVLNSLCPLCGSPGRTGTG